MLRKTLPVPSTRSSRRDLRVLFALPGLHRVVRGAEVALEALAHEVARVPGFDVTVFGSGPRRPAAPYRYRQVPCVPRERFEGWPSLPCLRDHYNYEELTFAAGLLREFAPAAYDVTVTCGYPYTNWILRRGRSRRARHVFVTQNGDWMAQAGNWEYRFFACDGLVCTNQEYFARNATRWPSRLIPNGVDPAVFYPGSANRRLLGLPDGVPIALMVSALIPSKRVVEGIRAAARVPDLHLVVAGDGESRDAVRATGRQLLGDRFRQMTLPRERMPDLYRAADVFLHMSLDEPSANAYIEALATGLPIVTHDREVTRWTLEAEAFLVDATDEQAVAVGLADALRARSREQVDRRRRLAERRFSWAGIASEYCSFFEELASLS